VYTPSGVEIYCSRPLLRKEGTQEVPQQVEDCVSIVFTFQWM